MNNNYSLDSVHNMQRSRKQKFFIFQGATNEWILKENAVPIFESCGSLFCSSKTLDTSKQQVNVFIIFLEEILNC